jgi:diguanylate cyclase (GGDEF)-like protein/PAS domain S-box-containing protein
MDRAIRDDCYRFIFENSLDAILLTSPDGNIYRANPAACEMLQRTEKEICEIGRSGLVDMSDNRLAEAFKERALNGKVRAELSFIRKDGSIFPADCTSALFRDPEGRIWSVLIIHDISKSKKEHEEAKSFANLDYLTGIFNRRAFIERLQQEMILAKQKKTELSLLMIDIDHFKLVNDNYGHKCGDVVLQYLTKLISRQLHNGDTVGRYGGDEFVVCLPDTPYGAANEIAEKIRTVIEISEIKCDSNVIRITASIGIGTYNINSENEFDCDSFVSGVDRNMYIAKQHRNHIYGQQTA